MQNKVGGMILNPLVMYLCISFEEGQWQNKDSFLGAIQLKILIPFCGHWHFSLPWQGLKGGTKKQKYDKISEKKMLTPIEVTGFSE